MQKIRTFYTALLSLLLCASCDIVPQGIGEYPENKGMEVKDLQISEDYHDITMSVNLLAELDSCTLDDSTRVKATVREVPYRILPIIEPAQPELVSIDRVGPEEMKEFGVSLLVMVDLTLPQSIIAQQEKYLRDMRTLFSSNNMYVAFMLPYGNVSKVMPLTDYVLNNYMRPDTPLKKDIRPKHTASHYDDEEDMLPSEASGRAYLFRSVSTILQQMRTTTHTAFDYASRKAFIIFSDGMVYDNTNDIPLDPDHYLMQERLIAQSRTIDSNTSVFYVPLNAEGDDDNSHDSSNNIMQLLCTSSNGKMEKHFRWAKLEKHIMKSFGINHADYIVRLRNYNDKYFFGDPLYLSLVFRDMNGNVLASCYKEYSVASVYRPIHINNVSLRHIALQGILIGLLILALVYLTLQLLVPYIRYRIFRKRYIIDYRGTNMSFGSTLIPDTCYYCKAPFVPGDKIVVKCQHVMHEECWDENGGRCPEYSETASIRHAAIHTDADNANGMSADSHTCHQGSHFYDRSNLLNPRNATFYLTWLLLAIVSAIVSYTHYVAWHHDMVYDITLSFLQMVLGDGSLTVTWDDGVVTQCLSSRQLHILMFGACLAFFITMMMSVLTCHRGRRRSWISGILLRAISACLLTYCIFLAECTIVAVSGIFDGIFFFDWVSWTLSACVVVFLSTFRSRCRFTKKHIVHILITSTVCSILWYLLGNIYNTTQMVCLILPYIAFAIGIAMTIARRMPQNDHSFLNVIGAVKEMNIALYKWLREGPDAEVLIGKSIDCQLQVTWDLQGDVAPIHAKIFCRNGVPYIMPIDGFLLLNGKETIEEKSYRLYHGDTFIIGKTTFRYIEM